MKKIFILLFVLLPNMLFAVSPGTVIFKNRTEFYEDMKKVADDYVYVYIEHRDSTLLGIKEAETYAKCMVSAGPSYVYVKNENDSLIFIFTNDGHYYNKPTTYYAETWKNWYMYYVALNKKYLAESRVWLDIDEPENKLLKEMIYKNRF